MTTAVCTIFTKRELPYARVLMRSLAKFHPTWERHALLIDEVEGSFNPAAEPFHVIQVRHLPIPNKQTTLFFYDEEELRAATKPRFFTWLTETKGFQRVVFLDPRCKVYARLEDVVDALDDDAPLVVAPHLLGALRDAKSPGEFDVLRWGALDSALVATSVAGEQGQEFLGWWQAHGYREFLAEPGIGPNRDQRWLDLAAARFDAVILRNPGYNAAYFNLGERPLHRDGGAFTVRGQPLRFFQFEGFDPALSGRLSRFDERFGTDLPEAVEELIAQYVAELRREGLLSFRGLRYAYEAFDGSAKISALARRVYREDRAVQDQCGDDPFAAGIEPFNRPSGRHAFVTKIMARVWFERPDLQRAFPNLDELYDARAFADWFLASAEADYGLSREYLEPVRAAIAGAEPPHRPARPNGVSPTASTPGSPPKTIGEELPRRFLFGRTLKTAVSLGAAVLRQTAPALLERPIPKTILSLLEEPERRQEHVVIPTNGAMEVAPLVPALERPRLGLNIAGYVTADMGVGQSARSAAQAAEAAGLDYALIDFGVGTFAPKTDRTHAHKIADVNAYAVNLIHVNADQLPHFRGTMGPTFFDDKYNIGYWHWELPELPDEWLPSFEGLDEVWVPTQFVLAAVSAKSPVPVTVIPHAISFSVVDASRERFGLPNDAFLFLTMYDLMSYQERKNPLGAISAFRKAFGGSDRARLVVKVLNGDKRPDDLAVLRESLSDLPGTVLVTETLSRQDVYDLEAACDAFVALHRSEGFGLGLAESMYLGKPVIATHWSGNVDFMNGKNSCPVDYRLIELDRDHGPYKKGQRWADADTDHAAWYMQKLVEDGAYRGRIGERAQAWIREELSPASVGARYRARLGLLQRRHSWHG